ncbi:major facilitator superfamily protein [Hirsutella rhossiliensis]|uniref:Major facilitator superfamily domain-containing protein n=1 Tax=Hirsutella rhossiliensis TaxID=111463 RepID=A0A9P8SMS2_9HYPO|nr:major facilitator superfamily domain-containing protein [Hirsutella rhossiliensis]KAH0967160.1 major facilitator superfamily domain-containing protein [Hirsutella rhossiliensis]
MAGGLPGLPPDKTDDGPAPAQLLAGPATETRPTSSNASRDDAKDAGDAPALPLSKARCIALVATVTGAAFLNTLSIQSVVIILPAIGRDLAVPDSRQQWIVSSYSLAFGCFLLFWGRVADIYGKRLIFVLGSVWVTVLAAANPFMPHEVAFDLFRGLHGLGAAANVPTAIGILGVTFPPGKAKNYAFSTYAAGAPLGNVFGNLFSGLIAEYSSWRWVFGASAVLAGVIAVAGVVFIPSSTELDEARPAAAAEEAPMVQAATTTCGAETRRTGDAVPVSSSCADDASPRGPRNPSPPPSIDWIGAGLITTGLVALMFALTEGSAAGWSTPWVPATIAASLLVIAGFVLWQRHLERLDRRGGRRRHRLLGPPPLMKVSMFGNARFSAVMVIMGLFFASFNSFLVYATYFFQDFQGLSPLQTMLRFVPAGATGAVIALVVAQLLGRVPTLFILVCGNLAVAAASLLFALPIPPSTSYFAFGLPAMMLSVLGADTTWPCLTLFTSQALPREDQAVGGALINAVGQFGRAIGLAVSTAVQTAVVARARGVPVGEADGVRPWEPESLRGLRAANWVNFAYGMASLAVVLVAFRSMDVVGRTRPLPLARSGVRQGDARQDKGARPDVGTRV